MLFSLPEPFIPLTWDFGRWFVAIDPGATGAVFAVKFVEQPSACEMLAIDLCKPMLDDETLSPDFIDVIRRIADLKPALCVIERQAAWKGDKALASINNLLTGYGALRGGLAVLGVATVPQSSATVAAWVRRSLGLSKEVKFADAYSTLASMYVPSSLIKRADRRAAVAHLLYALAHYMKNDPNGSTKNTKN